MHLSRLSTDVRRRHQIHHQTQSFSHLLHTKHSQLTQKEAAQTNKINYPSLVQDCRVEESRWERNWTTLKGEYILDTLKETLTPVPPLDFFSQSYEEAFTRHGGPEKAERAKSIVVGSSASIRSSIANLGDMERDLEAQIVRLETVLGPLSPSSYGAGTGTGTGSSSATTTPRKGVRKSLPPTPVLTPSSSPRGRLEFTRSYSRLERRASESPLRGRGLVSEHGIFVEGGFVLILGNTLESLKHALSELEGNEARLAAKGFEEGDKVKRVERSNIPRRHMSVNLR